MRLATRITIGVLAVELVALGVLLLLADRWQDMGWPALGMDHWVVGLGFALPPLVVLTAVVLVLLVGTRILVVESTVWRARRGRRRAQAEDGLSAMPPLAARR